MKVVLHAGGNKTGTTAVQSSMSAMREALRERDVLYPDLKITDEVARSHWPLAVAFQEDPQDYYLLKDRNLTADEARQYGQDVLKTLEAQIEQSGASTVLLSSEALAMLQESELHGLKDYLQSRFDEMEVVFVGRPAESAAISFYQAILVGGRNWAFDTVINNPTIRFGALAEKLKSVFGDTLDLRVFDRKNFLRQDFVAELLSRYVGLTDNLEPLLEKRDDNPSLSAATAALIYFLNKSVDRRKDGDRNPLFFEARHYARVYDLRYKSPKLAFPDERWMAYFRLSTAQDWLLFLKTAGLSEEAAQFEDRIASDREAFGEVKEPTRFEIDAWMRRNVRHLNKAVLPPEIRKAYSEGLSQPLR